MATSKKTPQKYSSTSQTSQSTTQQQSQTSKTLNAELMNQILAGLQGGMTDEEIAAFAENLMKPQLNAGLEAAQQQYETTRLGKEQEIENLAAELERSIREQNAAYGPQRRTLAEVNAMGLAHAASDTIANTATSAKLTGKLTSAFGINAAIANGAASGGSTAAAKGMAAMLCAFGKGFARGAADMAVDEVVKDEFKER